MIARRLATAFTWLMVGAFVFPIVWLLLTALKPGNATFAIPPVLFFVPTLEHFAEALSRGEFASSLVHSVIVSSAATIFGIAAAVPAAYVIATSRPRVRRVLRVVALLPQLLPPIVLVVPLFLEFRALAITDTLYGLAFAYLTITIPVSIWVLVPFIEDLPPEIQEAAVVDGAGPFTIVSRLVLPLIRPGVVAAAAISILYTWNEFFYALILTSRDAKTATVSVVSFMTVKEMDWGRIAAAGILVLLPVLIFALAAQRQLTRGLVSGSVK
jgi:multiple sugar transport system permease protein